MPRNLTLIAVIGTAFVLAVPGRAQDSQPLGDIARQAQKDKAKNSKPVAKVLTDDDLQSGQSGLVPNLPAAMPSAAPSAAASGGSPAPVQSPQQGLSELDAGLVHLESLDRAALAMEVLNGNTANFPGRAEWEQKLFAAKQKFVTQTRTIMQKVKEIAASASTMEGAQDPNDPRVKNLAARMQQLVAQAQENGEVFKSVAEEGKQLAAQAAGK